MAAPKTFDEHHAYLHQIVHLQLWLLWHWLRQHPDESFQHALRERVDIYRKLDLNPGGINPPAPQWDDPAWVQLAEQAETLFLAHRRDANALRFESEAFEVFRAGLDARARRDFADASSLAGYEYGSIRFDPPAEGRTRVSIHIANAVAPNSIFDDPAYLPGCLLETMRRAEEAHGATELDTFTWLNAHPRWLALFPDEWQQHLSAPGTDIQWHYGYWGQFLTARGTFHARRAQQLRETGELPLYPRSAWCTFAALRTHLEGLLAAV